MRQICLQKIFKKKSFDGEIVTFVTVFTGVFSFLFELAISKWKLVQYKHQTNIGAPGIKGNKTGSTHILPPTALSQWATLVQKIHESAGIPKTLRFIYRDVHTLQQDMLYQGT